VKRVSKSKDFIVVKGARAHNLKNIDVTIPRNQLVVVTGLSGSGKSSLAFDTIYAEGQRRYVESLSAYARQFLGQMDKPDVDTIEGLSPAISIDQKTTSRNPRSTVGTVTEIYDYLRLLFARIGTPICPNHGIEITSQTVEQMVDRVLEYPERTKLQVLAPIVSGRKGAHVKVLEDIKKQGYVRVRVDGEMLDVSEDIALDKILALTHFFHPSAFNSNSKSLSSAARSKSNAFAASFISASIFAIVFSRSFFVIFLAGVASYVSVSSAAVVARITSRTPF